MAMTMSSGVPQRYDVRICRSGDRDVDMGRSTGVVRSGRTVTTCRGCCRTPRQGARRLPQPARYRSTRKAANAARSQHSPSDGRESARPPARFGISAEDCLRPDRGHAPVPLHAREGGDSFNQGPPPVERNDEVGACARRGFSPPARSPVRQDICVRAAGISRRGASQAMPRRQGLRTRVASGHDAVSRGCPPSISSPAAPRRLYGPDRAFAAPSGGPGVRCAT